MALAAILNLEQVNELPDAVKAEYSEADDGRYHLQVTAVDGHGLENVEGLKQSLSSARKERDNAAKKLKTFDGLDPTEAGAAIAKLAELGDDASIDEKVKVASAAREKTLVDKHAGEIQIEVAKSGKYRSQLATQLIDTQALKAMSGQKLQPHAEQLLLPHVRAHTRIVELEDGSMVARVVDKEGNERVTSRQGSQDPMTVEEFVDGMKDNEMYALAFTGSGARGSGASTSKSRGKEGEVDLSKATPEQKLALVFDKSEGQ